MPLSELERALQNTLDLESLEVIDPELKEWIAKTKESLDNVVRILRGHSSSSTGWRDTGREYMRKVQEGSGLVDQVPEIMRIVSKKVSTSESLVANWPSSLLFR